MFYDRHIQKHLSFELESEAVTFIVVIWDSRLYVAKDCVTYAHIV